VSQLVSTPTDPAIPFTAEDDGSGVGDEGGGFDEAGTVDGDRPVPDQSLRLVTA